MDALRPGGLFLRGQVILAFCLGLFVPAAQGQSQTNRFRWSNPQPHGANVYDVAYGLGVTVQVAERGQVYTSDDLLSWTPRSTPTTNSLRGAAFLGNRLIISGERGTVLYADSLEEFVLVDLGTANWLEAVAASSQRAVAVGDNGAIYVSTDGVSWSPGALPAGRTDWLRGVAFGGSTFVVVGENGLIATANNSAGAWTLRSSPVATHLNRVAYVNGEFWVAGESGVLLRSANGTDWTRQANLPAVRALHSVAGTNQTLLVAGDQELWLSTNQGGTWSNELAPTKVLPAPVWTYYNATWEGSLFLLSGRSGMTVEGFTTNATDYIWPVRHESRRSWLWSVHRAPEFYLAVGDRATLLSSAKGVTWNLELTPQPATNNILLGVGGGTNGLVVAGNQGTILFSTNASTQVVFTNRDDSRITNTVSTLGVHWTAVDPRPVAVDLQGVAERQGLYVVSGGSGTILTSTNGLQWAVQSTPVAQFLSCVEAYPGGFVAVGDGGTILTSPDGTNWTSRASGTGQWLSRVRHRQGLLIAVGEGGTVLTSPDGALWTSRSSGTTKWLNDVDHANGLYYAAGNQGALIVSSNAVNWTSFVLPTQKSIFGVANRGSQLILVGVEGVVLRSPLQAETTPASFVSFGREARQNLMLIAGVPDQRVQLERSTNLVDWVLGPVFEITDRDGTLLILESTDLEDLPREFLRARNRP